MQKDEKMVIIEQTNQNSELGNKKDTKAQEE